MGFLDFLKLGNKISDIEAYARKGALIIDVRSHEEYAGGHVMGAKNIPLKTLQHQAAEIKSWNKPIIACCQSGMRSAQATSLLKKNGIDCINGGGWSALNNKLAAI
jgi:rhodanese-related sulfurtransferase